MRGKKRATQSPTPNGVWDLEGRGGGREAEGNIGSLSVVVAHFTEGARLGGDWVGGEDG